MTKAESTGVAILAVIGLAVAGIVKFVEAVGPATIIVGVAIAAALYVFFQYLGKQRDRQAHQARLDALRAKYKDEDIVQRIVSKTCWVGETAEQLRDSLGAPVDIDEKVYKTKRKEVWKYGHKGGNRFAYRITLENGEVVGWDEKA